jgi:hypothetical protein
MAMTSSRRSVYRRKWYSRECKENMRMRRKEYNRKVRHAKITEDSCDKGYVKNLRKLEWDTMY